MTLSASIQSERNNLESLAIDYKETGNQISLSRFVKKIFLKIRLGSFAKGDPDALKSCALDIIWKTLETWNPDEDLPCSFESYICGKIKQGLRHEFDPRIERNKRTSLELNLFHSYFVCKEDTTSEDEEYYSWMVGEVKRRIRGDSDKIYNKRKAAIRIFEAMIKFPDFNREKIARFLSLSEGQISFVCSRYIVPQVKSVISL